jgi:hypothetical protein
MSSKEGTYQFWGGFSMLKALVTNQIDVWRFSADEQFLLYK